MVSRSDAKARFPTCVPVMGGQSHHLSHRSPARATDQQYQRVNRQGYRRRRLPGPRPRRWRRRAGDRARRTPRHGAPDWPSHRPGEIVARGELDMYSAPRTGRRAVCSVGRAAAAQARVGSRPSRGSSDRLAKRCWSGWTIRWRPVRPDILRLVGLRSTVNPGPDADRSARTRTVRRADDVEGALAGVDAS